MTEPVGHAAPRETASVDARHVYRFHHALTPLAPVFGNDWFAVKAEAFARFFGTPAFLLGQTLVVIGWIAINAAGLVAFDIYPFILLNLAFSLQAAYAAPMILLAQTRQADRDKAHALADAEHREDLHRISEARQSVSETQVRLLVEMMQQNTALTEAVKSLAERIEALTEDVHRRVIRQPNGSGSGPPAGERGASRPEMTQAGQNPPAPSPKNALSASLMEGRMAAMIGREVRRKEDERLVTGAGCFADDLDIPGATHAVFVRSPHAHAKLRAINTDAARAAPGVLGVFTAQDLVADGVKAIPHATGGSKMGSDMPLAFADGSERLTTKHLPLPVEKVRFPGEAVCMVIAETRYAAEAAAELVDVDYDPLPAAPRAVESIAAEAAAIWDHVPGNLLLDAELGDRAATDVAFVRAAHRVSLKTQIQRVTGVHMEPRASAAIWDAAAQHLTLHASHGIGVVQMRSEIATVLGLDVSRVRIVAPPDVGGNFGTRNATYPEFCCVAWAARKLGRPVRQVTLRSEAFLSDYQARDLYVEIELALDREGKFLALRSSNLSNVGAHTASFVALNKGLQLMSSVYDVPVAHLRGRAALSNTPSTIPYRSAGRPEAMFVIERLVDVAARQCGFDRVELRRRNLIPADAMPYKNPAGVTYDNGDYRATMERVLEVGDWNGFPARREEAKSRGKLRGIGVANYVETTSGAPRERAEIVVGADGAVDCIIGTQASGQGHETSFSMLIADWLGVPFDSIGVRYGDTAFVQAGGGSHSGRSMRFASLVIRNATFEIIEKGKKIAGAVLEASVEDIGFADGVFRVAGTDRSIGIFEIAAAALNNPAVPEELRGPLGAVSDKITTGLAYPFGAQVVEIEVDPDTGSWEIVRYTALDDVGRAVNPLILHGQTHGGIAQGAGQALMEQCYYDPQSGQMLTASFMDYAMPRAADFPKFITELSETPATSHPLGFRPGGEGGTTPALGVCINAIVDALSEFGVTHLDMPATPLKIWKAMQSGGRDS